MLTTIAYEDGAIHDLGQVLEQIAPRQREVVAQIMGGRHAQNLFQNPETATLSVAKGLDSSPLRGSE